MLIPALVEHVSPLSQPGGVILSGKLSSTGSVKPGDKMDRRLEDNATAVEPAKNEFEAVGKDGKYELKA
jgi:hypothetical protein